MDKCTIDFFLDFGNGSSASMLDAIRHTIIVSKLLKTQKPAHYKSISIPEAFTMATLGSARGNSHHILQNQVLSLYWELP